MGCSERGVARETKNSSDDSGDKCAVVGKQPFFWKTHCKCDLCKEVGKLIFTEFSFRVITLQPFIYSNLGGSVFTKSHTVDCHPHRTQEGRVELEGVGFFYLGLYSPKEVTGSGCNPKCLISNLMRAEGWGKRQWQQWSWHSRHRYSWQMAVKHQKVR